MDRRIGLRARTPAPGPSRPPRRTVVAWQRGSAVARHHAASASATAASSRTGSSQWTWSIPPWRPMTRIASNSCGIGQAEVEDHERLRGRDPGIDGRRELRERVVAVPAHREAEADSRWRCRRPSPRATRGRPVSSDRSAAGDEPVPGLLNDRNVVVPPNAAATESWKNRSGSASVATRVCVWTSTAPGRTSSPVASTVSRRRRRGGRRGRARSPRSARRGPPRPPAATRRR